MLGDTSSGNTRIRIRGADGGSAESDIPSTNTTSMIDVIFILLIFFLVVSQLRESKIEVGLQATKGSEESPENVAAKVDTLEIAITADNVIFVRDQATELGADLEALLAKVVETSGTDVKIRLRSDSKSESGTMLQVLGLLSEAGLTRVEFAVRPTRSTGGEERGS